MTSPQSSYPHGGHGPGPSYYQHSPVYTSNSPGPNPYAYQSNGRGGAPAYNSRNPPHNPYPYYPPYGHHPAPVPMQPPHPPQHSYSRNPPFSQGYGYLNPAAVPFTPPPRHTPQPMSPTPKRPAMPPPHVNSSGYYDPSPEIPVVSHLPPGPVPIMSPRAQKPSVPPQLPIPPSVEPSEGSAGPVNGLEVNESPSDFSIPEEEQRETPPSPEPSLSTPAPQSSAYNQMGTIHTQEPSSQPENTWLSEPVEPSSELSPAHPLMSWAVWSRRPRDPSNAPGIIISPKARPPPKIIDGALESKTPPASSPPSPVKKKKKLPPPASRVNGLLDVISSQTSSTVPSSAGTESADTPTVPGSPQSTNTSISTSGGHEETALKLEVKEPSKPESEEVTEEAQPSVASVAESSDLSSKDQEVSSTPTPAPVPAVQVLTPKVEAAPTPEPVAEPSASTSAPPTPAPAPTAPPKKSWASLLRPAESSSATTTPTKNALPTSSIVGFSIPAGVTSSPPPQPVSPSKKTELINLLTSNPSNAPITSRIRPRGLVNSGNMCFANAVLQILLYCAPFHRLFVELGKLLPAVATQKDSTASGSSASSVTPLVEATATFLKEFVTLKKPLLTNGKSSGVASGSGYGRGNKGKERELMEMDDDWDLDSFLPTYIYDAMKEKKRFDTMRGGQQEDAEEFLGFYLDTLEEELLSMLNSTQPSKPQVEETETVPTKEEGWMEVGKKNRTVVTRTIKATESPITRIFGGKSRSTLRAPRQKDSVVVEDWRSLRLDIQREQIRTIQDALSYISHPEPVQVSIPTQPGVAVEATQQVLIESLPPILVLHIKRFCYDMNVKGVVKVGKQVQFGPELEIGSDLMAPAAKKTGPTRYKLFGALYHHGLSASGGHYTLDVLHPNRYPSFNSNTKPKEGWVRIDDELVSDVRPEDVFGAAQEKDDSRCAYLLFYCRV
ncbi:hypothetical protein MD484_g5175, partial [Candolleomyces efflorescens]